MFRMKRILAVLLCLTLLCVCGLAATALAATEKYIEYTMDPKTRKYVPEEKPFPVGATVLTGEVSEDLTGGWYVAQGNVTFSSRLHISGNVCLILKDDCKVMADVGITVNEDDSLTIYAQKRGTGSLTASGL